MVTEKFTHEDLDVDVIFDEDVYLHATSVSSKFKKRPETWLKTQQTQSYISALKSVLPDTELVIVNNGGLTPGTWIHPKLSVAFARWLDPYFAVWCDQKIETLLQKGYAGATDSIQDSLDTLAPKIKAIKSYVRKTGGGVRINKLVELFGAMEESAHTIGDYRNTISKVTTSASTEDREKVYDKLIRGTYKAFNSGAISRRTEEDILQILNANLIKLLRRRFTEATKGIVANPSNDSVNKYIDEIQDLKEKLAELEGELEDPRPLKFELRTNFIIQDVLSATKDIQDNDYAIIFNGILSENVNKTEKKHPDWRGDSKLTAKQTGAGMWENDGYYWLNIAINTPPYAALCKIELYQSPSDEVVFVGTDNVRRHFGTFNQVTGHLIVYRKK